VFPEDGCFEVGCFEDGPLAGHLAGPLSDLGQHARHLVAGLFTGRQIVLALICVAVIVVLLIIPVIGENLFNAASAGAEKVAPGAFFLGLGVLAIGLVFGTRMLDIVGAGLMSAVLIGALMKHY
jgi:hypothetical protein